MRWKILEKKLRVLEAEYAWFKCFVWLKGYIYKGRLWDTCQYIAQVSDRIHAHVDVFNVLPSFGRKCAGLERRVVLCGREIEAIGKESQGQKW